MTAAAPDGKSAIDRLSGKGVYPVKYAWLLTTPLRQLILPASTVTRRLALKQDERVLEIGCGPGWFAPTIARALPLGRLTLLDLQPGMLNLAERRLQRQGVAPGRYELRVGDATALPFDNASFDAAFAVTVLGETPDPATALREAARVLAPDGRLLIIEQAGDPDMIKGAEIIAAAQDAGLQLTAQSGPRWMPSYLFKRRPLSEQ